jgi:hypothetical protein
VTHLLREYLARDHWRSIQGSLFEYDVRKLEADAFEQEATALVTAPRPAPPPVRDDWRTQPAPTPSDSLTKPLGTVYATQPRQAPPEPPPPTFDASAPAPIAPDAPLRQSFGPVPSQPARRPIAHPLPRHRRHHLQWRRWRGPVNRCPAINT